MPAYYRIVRSQAPTVEDFTSNAAAGLTLRPPVTSERLRLWRGVSVYNSRQAAEASAARTRWRNGRYIAELVLQDHELITVEKTLRDPAHYTMWGEPAMLLAIVANVTPIEAAFI